jgi:hypothetical protein
MKEEIPAAIPQPIQIDLWDIADDDDQVQRAPTISSHSQLRMRIRGCAPISTNIYEIARYDIIIYLITDWDSEG